MDRTQQAAHIFNEYALQYQEKYMDQDIFKVSLNNFSEYIKKPEARLLEIGCGPGNITKYLLQKRPDLKIFGIDLAPKMIELARINNPTAEFRVMDCREINMLKEKYDAVVCGFCLPYLSKPDSLQLIEDISDLLNSGGLFYLSTMEADHIRSGYIGPSSGKKEKGLYTWYHETSYLKEYLKRNNFEILELNRYENPVYNDNSIKDLVILAIKK